MRTLPRIHARAAFTLLEVLVAVAVAAGSLWLLGSVLRSARNALLDNSRLMGLETEGSRTLQRVVEALRAADADSIASLPAPPFSAAGIDFQVVEPYDGVRTPMSAPRRIDVEPSLGAVRWIENPGLASERRTHWSSGVAPLLEGELANGADDNGNGLVDEPGLCFSREGTVVTVCLTLTSERADGTPLVRTWRSRLLCRN